MASKKKGRKPASKDQLMAIYKLHKQTESKAVEEASNNASRANMLITLGILIQFFEFSPEECEEFVDRYGEVLENFKEGNEDVNSVADAIRDHCGISVEYI